MRLEDGALSLAEDLVRAAEAALREALENGADAKEIAALMDALRQALDEYLAQLSQTAEGESLLDSETPGAFEQEGLRLGRDDLQALVDQAQDMAMTGATDAAREMLDELQRLLESLRAESQLPSQEGEGEALGANDLDGLHGRKTGALLMASLVVGARAARATDHVVEAVRRYGASIGLAFQIADDLLDATQSTEMLGKRPSDTELDKSTYVGLYGLEEARNRARAHVDDALEALASGGIDAPALNSLALYVVERDK